MTAASANAVALSVAFRRKRNPPRRAHDAAGIPPPVLQVVSKCALRDTCVIVTVLLFGGALILNTNYAPMDAATFIFYLIILYSIINPLKEFSRAFYNIPQGLASMERIDMILKAENHIVEPEQPLPLDAFTDKLEFKNVSFSYVEGRPVLNHINLTVPKGKTIALVGQSGSGKSTLVDLVPRLFRPRTWL